MCLIEYRSREYGGMKYVVCETLVITCKRDYSGFDSDNSSGNCNDNCNWNYNSNQYSTLVDLNSCLYTNNS